MAMKNIFATCIFMICLIISMPICFAATQNLIYDANGNLITGDGKFRQYNGFNKLVRVRDGNNATGLILEEYGWHPTEDRTEFKHVYENGTWKETVFYVSKTFVQVKNTSGTFNYKYIYQNGQIVAQEDYARNKLFFSNDHLGSVGLITNGSGAKVEETFYGPFGEIISGGNVSRFDYEAKEYDSVVGDYDFHARRMIPEWGNKPTQPDTIIQNVYNPQNLNRYAFELDNPYNRVDPDGHISPLVAIVGIIALVIVLLEAVNFIPIAYESKKLSQGGQQIPDAMPDEIPLQNTIHLVVQQPSQPILSDASPANQPTTTQTPSKTDSGIVYGPGLPEDETLAGLKGKTKTVSSEVNYLDFGKQQNPTCEMPKGSSDTSKPKNKSPYQDPNSNNGGSNNAGAPATDRNGQPKQTCQWNCGTSPYVKR